MDAYFAGINHSDAELKMLRALGVDVPPPSREVAATSTTTPLAPHGGQGPGVSLSPEVLARFERVPAHQAMANVFAAAAQDAIEGASFQIHRAANDQFRRLNALVLGREFQEAALTTRRQMSRRLLEGYAKEGLTAITYANGRRVQLSSYAEMVGRTTSGRAAMQASLLRYQERGYDLLVISAHFETCPLCSPWEGAIVSQSGAPSNYPSLEEAINQGLYHPNCAHDATPYIPGVTKIPEPRVDTEMQRLIDKHGREGAQRIAFKARQKQRYIERKIREWKKRELIFNKPGTANIGGIRTRQWQASMRDHLRQHPYLPRKPDREQLAAILGPYAPTKAGPARIPPRKPAPAPPARKPGIPKADQARSTAGFDARTEAWARAMDDEVQRAGSALSKHDKGVFASPHGPEESISRWAHGAHDDAFRFVQSRLETKHAWTEGLDLGKLDDAFVQFWVESSDHPFSQVLRYSQHQRWGDPPTRWWAGKAKGLIDDAERLEVHMRVQADRVIDQMRKHGAKRASSKITHEEVMDWVGDYVEARAGYTQTYLKIEGLADDLVSYRGHRMRGNMDDWLTDLSKGTNVHQRNAMASWADDADIAGEFAFAGDAEAGVVFRSRHAARDVWATHLENKLNRWQLAGAETEGEFILMNKAPLELGRGQTLNLRIGAFGDDAVKARLEAQMAREGYVIHEPARAADMLGGALNPEQADTLMGMIDRGWKVRFEGQDVTDLLVDSLGF